jgi:hypothetical protein
MSSCRFEDYIGFLRDNINNLIEYREATGTLEPNLLKIRNDLFNQDPFVVIGASVQATKAFAADNLYH